jgi:hypothetical protein
VTAKPFGVPRNVAASDAESDEEDSGGPATPPASDTWFVQPERAASPPPSPRARKVLGSPAACVSAEF